jgi:folate-dependent phosphoribosylglycinamide formyltransferase PurN
MVSFTPRGAAAERGAHRYTGISMLRYIRAARAARVWVPDHFRLCAAQVIDIDRNRRVGFSDDDHLSEAISWLQRAQDVTGDGGVSGRYDLSRGWTSSYPETTGYIVPTLLKLAGVRNDRAFVDRAERCVRFLLSTQLESGAFPGGEIAENSTKPSPFNSAQIIHGLLAWHRHAGDERALRAAIRAAEWLISVQDEDGAFRQYFYLGVPATYSSHASCWLAELGEHIGNRRYLEAAGRHLDWVLQHFDESKSWFDLCGFGVDEHKARVGVSHTIAYTIFGVLHMSQILRRADGIRAARLAALRALRRAEIRGAVPGVMNANWQAAADYTCLTGSAQLALIWFRFFELDNDIRYVNAALKAIDEVKRAQPMHLKHPGLRGGIPGSAPLWGAYIKHAVPNWAAKYFIDALLTKKEIISRLVERKRTGAPIELDRGIEAPLDCSVRLPQKPRVVFYTTASSVKPHQLLSETDRWGFAPAAIVVEKGVPVPFARRLNRKLRDEGVIAVFRSLLTRVRLVEPSAASRSAEKSATAKPEQLCRERGIPIWILQSVNTPEAVRIISSLRPDLAVNVGGGILRKPVLDAPKFGTLNAHMGLLPFYRGMNVAEWAALNSDPVGCTVHCVDTGIDTGAIIATRSVDRRTAASVSELRGLVDRAQIRLLSEVLEWIFSSQTMPAVRMQTVDGGVQFFGMCDELKCFLENMLRSSSAQATTLERSAASCVDRP